MMFEKNDNDRQALYEPPSSGFSGTVAQASKEIRLGFIRKVYGILSIQLLATALTCALAMKLTSSEKVGDYFVLSFGTFLASSYGFQLFIFIFSLIILVALMCLQNRYPINMALLSVWTIAMSMSVASACAITVCDPMVLDDGNPVPNSISSQPWGLPVAGALSCATGTDFAAEGGNAVILAATITAIIFFSLTAFTIQSKWDFSFMGAGLGVALCILCMWGFGMMIFGGGASMRYFYSLAGAIIFSLYIIFDTWLKEGIQKNFRPEGETIVGCTGKEMVMVTEELITQKLGPDDYIMGAINLYLDIINLFLFILQLLGRRD